MKLSEWLESQREELEGKYTAGVEVGIALDHLIEAAKDYNVVDYG